MPSSRASPETVPETEVLAPVLVTSLGEHPLLICECLGRNGSWKAVPKTLASDSCLATGFRASGAEPANNSKLQWDTQEDHSAAGR